MKVFRIVLLVLALLFAGPAITATVAVVTGYSCAGHPKATICGGDSD